MSEATRAVRDTLADLIAVLEATASVEGPDRLNATRAAANLRATLALIGGATDVSALREGFRQAWYATGERGMFEWAWSPALVETLQAHAERVGQALDRADRRARRKPHAS